MLLVGQTMRPKHQVLIMKCFPRFQKNNVDAKPNSSELSYLLYYVSTRRSKLQKVGDFLYKRASVDVKRTRIENVVVNLAIHKALIEKCPRDLALYANSVLRTLRTVLNSFNINMIEASVPTFNCFCEHQGSVLLSANHDIFALYKEVVIQYASFASKSRSGRMSAQNVPLALRFRKTGLDAVRGMRCLDPVNSETSGQLSKIIPAILENLYSEDSDNLEILEAREQELDKETLLQSRPSISTVRTVETTEIVGSSSTALTSVELDKLAEQDIGVLALQALRQFFIRNNRMQILQATSAIIAFFSKHFSRERYFSSLHNTRHSQERSWPVGIIELVCKWVPVQDRFVVLVTLTEVLVRNSGEEENLEKQLILVDLIDHLLSSQTNFIGLSVIDILVGLIQRSILLMQSLPTNGSVHDISPRKEKDFENKIPADDTKNSFENRHALTKIILEKLQSCIGGLANHIYYRDQISDLTYGILRRIRPVTSDNGVLEVSRGRDDMTESSSNQKSISNSGSVCFGTRAGQLFGLECVKRALLTANRGDLVEAQHRSSVTSKVWDGSFWLLQVPDWEVRSAYVDILVAWLELEHDRNSLILQDEGVNHIKDQDTVNGTARGCNVRSRNMNGLMSSGQLIKGSGKDVKFLEQIHTVIYEHAHEFSSSKMDILLLHLVLTKLIEKLGVNAVERGLPMMIRLQEDIQDIDEPISKIYIGALVHGYLWSLSTNFGFVKGSTDDDIQGEIKRRKAAGLWLTDIKIPPLSIEAINKENIDTYRGPPSEVIENESLKPFDYHEALVNDISRGYSTIVSQILGTRGSVTRTQLRQSNAFLSSVNRSFELPAATRARMMSDWKRCTRFKVGYGSGGVGEMFTTPEKVASRGGMGGISGREDNLSGSIGSSCGRSLGWQASGNFSMLGLGGGTGGQNDSWDYRNGGLRVEDLKRALSGAKLAESERGSLGQRPTDNKTDMDDVESAPEILNSGEDGRTDARVGNTGSSMRESSELWLDAAENLGTSRENSSAKLSMDGNREQYTSGVVSGTGVNVGSKFSCETIPPVPPIPLALQNQIRGQSSSVVSSTITATAMATPASLDGVKVNNKLASYQQQLRESLNENRLKGNSVLNGKLSDHEPGGGGKHSEPNDTLPEENKYSQEQQSNGSEVNSDSMLAFGGMKSMRMTLTPPRKTSLMGSRKRETSKSGKSSFLSLSELEACSRLASRSPGQNDILRRTSFHRLNSVLTATAQKVTSSSNAIITPSTGIIGNTRWPSGSRSISMSMNPSNLSTPNLLSSVRPLAWNADLSRLLSEISLDDDTEEKEYVKTTRPLSETESRLGGGLVIPPY